MCNKLFYFKRHQIFQLECHFSLSSKGKGHLASCSINVPPFMIGFQSFIKTYHASRHKAMIKKPFFPPQSGHWSFFPALGSLQSILFHYLVSN